MERMRWFQRYPIWLGFAIYLSYAVVGGNLRLLLSLDSGAWNHRHHAVPPASCPIPAGMKVVNATNRNGTVLFPMVVWIGDFISEQIAAEGYWEIGDVEELLDLAPRLPDEEDSSLPPRLPPPSDGIFMDLGCNLGFYSLLFAHAGYRVVAMDANPKMIAALRASLCFNPTFRIDVFHQGLSNSEKTCQLLGRAITHRNSHAMSNAIGRIACPPASAPLPPCSPKHGVCEVVRLRTLDRFVREYPALVQPRVAILKMDVEDHEREVLQGAREFLQGRYAPAMIQWEAKNKKGEIEQILGKELNYTLGTVQGKDGNTIARKQISQQQ